MRLRTSTIAAVGILAAFAFGLRSASALVVTDPATTAKNVLTAVLKSQMLDTLTEQGRRVRRMARRLSAFADLSRFSVTDTPRWRSYRFQDATLFATDYEDALNLGDPGGAAYMKVARARFSMDAEVSRLRGESAMAADAVAAQLATLDLADSSLMNGTDQNGQLRSQGKREMRATDALERDVVDDSSTQSTAAVLDKISAAVLVETKQKQSRLQFLMAVVEQLAVENKRARDTEAAAMNMELEKLRLTAECRTRCAGVLAGAANDLRSWRQP